MWYCSMNRDPDFSSCDAPEETIPKSVREEMIETKYSMGSIVWARQDGFPWLPAMVDENPDTSKFCLLRGASEVPMKYHVTYLNEKIEFAWINHRSLKVYKNNPREAVVKRIKFRNTDFSAYLTRGCRLAEEALLLTISQRLKRFGARVRLAREIERQNRSKSKYAVHPPHSVNNFTLKDGLPREKEMRIIEKEKLFDVGDVVWARGRGFPWWPAIVDTCPIHQKFMHIPKSRRESRMYHVVYFIKNKRIEYDWLPEENLRSFSKNRKNKLVKTTIAGKIDYKRPLNAAYETAMKADLMPLDERIRQFGMSGRSEQQLILSGAGLPNSLTKSPPYYEDVNPTQSTLPSQSESIDKKFLYALGNILNGNRSESCVQNNMTKKLKKSTKIPSMSNGARNIASIFSPKPSCSKVDDETSISTPDSNFRWTKMAGSSSSSWSDDFS
ncbi:uncharacterized protein [Venturia canescens]|uniref:uncharacterized protein n=1 Tax=Venturia canescens TaxID=32260 RepID=UPI001C9BFA6A|nr:uncharacterized protein LOC122407940 [Venturia canescens]